VFIEEQNVPIDIEIDGLDDKSEHVIAYIEDKPVGCARIRINNFAKLERIAVMRNYRDKGLGRKITEFLIDYCKQKNIDEIRLHAQLYTTDFYKRLGFIERGETFLEADIEHIEMYKKI
jgi:predicted GNAT family N-acyltransferase